MKFYLLLQYFIGSEIVNTKKLFLFKKFSIRDIQELVALAEISWQWQNGYKNSYIVKPMIIVNM